MDLLGWRAARRPTAPISHAERSNSRISEPNGTLYRDVPPGRYKVTVDSYKSTFFDQFADITLAAGEEAYIQVLPEGQRVGGESGTRENLHAGGPGRSRPPLPRRELIADAD
jgi:hypothetical protein